MVVSSAIRLTDGRVFVGIRHSDCFKNLLELHMRIGMEFEEARKLHLNCEQGLINDKLVFLDREIAYYEAFQCKQCRIQKPQDREDWKPCLMSEDIW